MNGLVVSCFLATIGKLGFYCRFNEPLKSVFNGFAQQLLTFAEATNIVAFDSFSTLFAFYINTDAQKPFIFSTPHSQQSMTGTATKRLTEIKII